MKRYIFLAFALALLLCGCTGNEPVPTTLPTAAPTIATEAPVWEPYSGSSRNYIYFHTEERDLKWEEDVIYFADNYLEYYPLLTHFPSRIEIDTEVEYSDKFYDPELRRQFIDQINGLIPQIPELTDKEILYTLQRMLAQLKDAHTSLNIEWENLYPIGFQEFEEEGEQVFYVTLAPEKYEHILMHTLSGINGVPLAEVIERLRPYISTENEYCLMHSISGGSSFGLLSNRDLLDIVGITDGTTAVYNLINSRGRAIDIEIDSYPAEDAVALDFCGHTHPGAYPEIYGEDLPNYFYRWTETDRMMYVRVNEFVSDYSYTFYDLGNDVIRELRDHGGAKKLVVDLRRNPGGYVFEGYVEFISALGRMDYESLYVLIDEGTFSGGVLMATKIKKQFPEAILAGTPAGQPPNFFAKNDDTEYVLPNSGVICRMPQAYLLNMEDYPYDALMPDLPVSPTVTDYIYCFDTILETVKAQ